MLGGYEPAGINDSGQVAYTDFVPPDEFHAFIYSISSGESQDLGSLGGGFSQAGAMNESGQVVGYSDLPDNSGHAFLYSGGAMQDLTPTLPSCSQSYAWGVNNLGQAVGDVNNRAVLFQNGTIVDLNAFAPTGVGFFSAEGINDSGQIIVNDLFGSGHAYLLTPIAKTGSISVTMLRCDPTAYANLDSGDIDTPLEPVPNPAVLVEQRPIGSGLVADGVTPLLLKLELNSEVAGDRNASYRVTFDPALGGCPANGIGVFTLQNGSFVAADTFSFEGLTTAYAYIPAIRSEDLTLGASKELSVTMHITKLGDSSVSGGVTFKIRKPPLILVHGYASSSATWSEPFLETLRQTRPDEFVHAIDYGIGALNPPGFNATYDALGPLAHELDDLLAGQVEGPTSIYKDWAFTRYDIVGHSQGGVLARMLCQTFLPELHRSDAPFAKAPVVSEANANRGRFGRVITIGSPQNGSTILRYVFDFASLLDQNGNSLARTISSGLSFYAQPKFDPWGLQMFLVNNKFALPVDNGIRFHCVRTTIGRFSDPLSYALLGLDTVPPGEVDTRGKILLPEGSDGVVDYDSQIGGGTTNTTITWKDISHCTSIHTV